jgi:biotin synthase
LAETVHEILHKKVLNKEDLVTLLSCNNDENQLIFQKAAHIQTLNKNTKIGLINISNFCIRDCFYCNKRKSNHEINRFHLTEKEIIDSIKYAHNNFFDSIVIQSFETDNTKILKFIEKLIKKINHSKRYRIPIILSAGENSISICKHLRKSKIEMYLIRIRTSSPELFKKIHPDNNFHNLESRINTVKLLKKRGFKTGTGIIVGLPFQTTEHLADDLLFVNKLEVDYCEIKTFRVKENTPVYSFNNVIIPFEQSLDLTKRMIALLRIIRNNIKIASSTSFQSSEIENNFQINEIGLDQQIIEITPLKNGDNYLKYDSEKTVSDELLKFIKF